MDKNQEKCHDCGVSRGEQHVIGCDWEECPECGCQIISCGCNYKFFGFDPDERSWGYVYKNGLTDEMAEIYEEHLKKIGYIVFGDERRFDNIK